MTFWGEIAPCDHVVQIYEDDNTFLDTLTGYVGSGINAGDCVVIIATSVHLRSLETRLDACGIPLESLKSEDRYIPLDAEETLAKFMINNWPDDNLFGATITSILQRAQDRNRTIRAFGEMVALLWAQGHQGATVRLETLWNEFIAKNPMPLFCAYPKSGFTQDINTSIDHICSSHTKMIRSSPNHPTQEIQYKSVR